MSPIASAHPSTPPTEKLGFFQQPVKAPGPVVRRPSRCGMLKRGSPQERGERMKIRMLAVAVAFFLVPAYVHASDAMGLGIRNGDFSRGTLDYWTGGGIDGGIVSVVKQGRPIAGLTNFELTPFAGGPGSYAVSVRSNKDGSVAST